MSASETFQQMPIGLLLGLRLADDPVNVPEHDVELAGFHDEESP
jgi:hypothetical protein